MNSSSSQLETETKKKYKKIHKEDKHSHNDDNHERKVGKDPRDEFRKIKEEHKLKREAITAEPPERLLLEMPKKEASKPLWTSLSNPV